MATDGVKLLRANVTILAAYPEAFADPNAPTAAELNDQYVASTNEDAMVFNISCAITDDYTLNMTDPDTDDTRTICDMGQVENPTFDNYEASLDGIRDKDVTAQGVYNLFWNLFKGVGRPFILIKRIGKANDAEFLTDGSDVISAFGVETDNFVDQVDDNTIVLGGARFKSTGDLLLNYSVVS